MKHVTITLVTQENGKTKSAVLSGNVGDLGSDKVDQFFVSDLRTALNEIDPLTGGGCAGQSAVGIVGDTCTVPPFDYVAEAKRQTLHHLLISVAERNGWLSAVDAANLVNQGYAALEESDQQRAEKSQTLFEAHQRYETQPEELTAALLTISNIQNAMNLPGEKGISEEVIELVQNMQNTIDTLAQPVTCETTVNLDFSDALKWLKAGYAVARPHWCDNCALKRINAKGKGGGDVLVTFAPAIILLDFTIYEPLQDDLLATDWYALNEPR